jgi:uncharacterized protein YdhG (YjbR/CyaY superfamily)
MFRASFLCLFKMKVFSINASTLRRVDTSIKKCDHKGMKQFKNIDSYIVAFPKDVQVILKKFRMTIRKAAPKAEEGMRYGIPTFLLNGNLVHFAAFKKHTSFFPTPSGVQKFKRELASFELSKGTVRFSLDTKIPFGLITRIVKFRVKQNLAKKSNSKPTN